MRALLVALVAASALACAGAPAAQAGPPQADRLYRSKCAACHRAYPPQSLGREKWAEVVSRMAPRAKLTAAERATLLDYLQANAKDAAGAGGHP